MTDLETPSFESHFREAFGGLRGALIDLLASVGADPATPQEIARKFQLNRGLTWKVSRIATATDPFAEYPQLPGSAAVSILTRAFKKAGASPESLAAVVDAFAEFDRMVELHAGDRATLELMIDSSSPDRGLSEPLEMSRRLAFRGNSGIRGIQAKGRIRTTILAPNDEDPSFFDAVQLSGLVKLRRFRASASWPIFVRLDFSDDGTPLENHSAPIFPVEDESDFLLTEYCSKPLPRIEVVPFYGGTMYELGEGPVGNRGVTDIIYGSVTRRFATRFRDESNEYGECFTDINAPIETALTDVILRDDLARDLHLEAKLIQGEQSAPLFGRRAVELPCPEQVQALGPVPQGAATALMPNYKGMLESIFSELGWDASRFHVMRLEMKYPPVPSKLLVRFPLESRR